MRLPQVKSEGQGEQPLQIHHSIPQAQTLLELFPDNSAKVIFFDLDGTLFHSEPLHASFLKELLKQFSIDPSWSELSEAELLKKFCGKSDNQVFQELKDAKALAANLSPANLAKFKDQFLTTQFYAQLPEDLCPLEIRSLLSGLDQNNVQMAIVSNSERRQIELFLDRYLPKNPFKFVIGREDTLENKPSPEPYLLAAKKMGIPIEQAHIFEDSQVGLESAKASRANIHCVQWFPAIEDGKILPRGDEKLRNL